jgi:DNA repair ATPase RecN
MVSPAIATVVKMLETLPEETQSQAVEHLREWLADLEDEAAWDESFARTRTKLSEATQQVRKQIAEGKAEPMDFSRL